MTMRKDKNKVVTPPARLFNFREDFAASLLLIFFWVLIVYKNFSRKVNSAIFPDNESMTNALLSSMSRTIKSNSWPFWDSNLWGGLTLSNQPQLTPFYPFYFLKFANYSGTLNSMRTVHLIVLLHVLIFLLTSYFLLRVLRISSPVAIIGSLIIVVNENTLGILSWLTAIATVVWVPTLIAGLILILRDRNSLGFYVFYGSVLLIASAAPSHRLIFGLYFTLVFCVYFYFDNARNLRSIWLKELLGKSIIPTTGFLILFIPIFFPFFLDANKLIRWIGDPPPGYIIGNQKIPYENFTHFQLELNQISDIALKSENFNAIGNINIGVYATVLFVVSIFIGFKSRIYKLFLSIALYSLVSAFGSNIGLSAFNYQLPYLNKIREPLQFLTFWNMALGICVALGIQISMDKLGLFRSYQIESNLGKSNFFSLMSKSTVLPAGLVVVTFTAQFFNTPWKMNLFESSTYVYDRQSQLNLAFDRINLLDPKHNYRVIFDSSINSQVAGGLASFKQIRTLQSYLNPAPVDLFEDMFAYDNRGPRYVDLLGVKYGICKGCNFEFAKGIPTFVNFKFIERVGEYSIFENQAAFPYAVIVDSYIEPLENKAQLLEKLYNLRSDSLFAYLESSAIKMAGLPTKEKPEICYVQSSMESPNVRLFSSTCQKGGVMIINEHYTPNWKLTIDKQAVPSFRVNGVQLGVYVPEGVHEVIASYEPVRVRSAINISIILFALLILMLVLKRCYKPKRVGNKAKMQESRSIR